jgi:hypothetical protein
MENYNFHVVLCQIWQPTLREGRRLSVCEDRNLRRIFGSKAEELARDWRKLNNVRLCSLYYSPNIIAIMKYNEMRRAYSTHETDEECV